MNLEKTRSRFRPSHSSLAMLCGATLLGTAASHAAVTAITSATVSGGDNQVRTLTSITVGGVTYGNLEGAVSASTTGTTRFWIETDPGSSNAALTGLTVSDGVLNSLASFQFGRLLTSSDMLFFFDLENDELGDAISVQLVNALGGDVGSPLGVSITGPRIFQDGFSNNGGAPIGGGTFGPTGSSFLVTDFTGDVTTATGFRVVQTDGIGVDPMLAGVTVIPEPGSVALAAGALCLGLLRRKRA